jgi:hypothetical protein
MEKLTNRLPEQEEAHLHPDFLENEESYWRVRESLLTRYRGKWVAVRAGQVVAEADDVLTILDLVAGLDGHPYIALVGDEGREFTIRSVFHSCRSLIQLMPGIERILGRDVLNQLRVTFDGPRGRVEIGEGVPEAKP